MKQISLMFAVLLLGVPAVGFAQDGAAPASETKPAPEVKPEPPLKDEDIGKQVGLLVGAVKEGKWSVVAGLLLSLLIWGVRKFNLLAWLDKVHIPWAVAALGVLAYIAAGLTAGLDWHLAVSQGFAVGLEAVGLWELILKKFLKPSLEPPQPTKAEEA